MDEMLGWGWTIGGGEHFIALEIAHTIRSGYIFFEVLEVFHKIYDKISESDDGDRRTNIGERIIRKNRLKSAKVFPFFYYYFGWDDFRFFIFDFYLLQILFLIPIYAIE